jgi:hypothetical protein
LISEQLPPPELLDEELELELLLEDEELELLLDELELELLELEELDEELELELLEEEELEEDELELEEPAPLTVIVKPCVLCAPQPLV